MKKRRKEVKKKRRKEERRGIDEGFKILPNYQTARFNCKKFLSAGRMDLK